ncbi:MAG: phosphatase PAP2 family protein [Pseudomonadota bacterium]
MCLVLIVLAACSRHASAEDAVLVTDWNAAVLQVAEAEDGFMTLKGLRTAAMMHLAMHDALNSVDSRYASYLPGEPAPDANPAVMATQAAFYIAADQYPDNRQHFEILRKRWLDKLSEDDVDRNDLAKGNAVAQAIIENRKGDGWDAEAEYRWHPMAPGVYAEFQEHSGTPQGFVFGAGWAKARGFALERPDQFRSPPPPDIPSAAYARAFNEVQALGRFQSMQRTPEQTHIALWWKDFVESSHNRLARDLIVKERLTLREAARLLALLNMAVFDGYVSSFDNKFHYNHWRPYTAIRWAEHDGNPDTAAEETWTNTHRHTYAFPSYPSAHGTACAAAMSAFGEVFGDDYRFRMRTPMVDVAGPFSGKIEMHPPTREFESFADAAMQCGLSRIYLGIHFRYDSEEGVRLGERVGLNVVSKHLRPTKTN